MVVSLASLSALHTSNSNSLRLKWSKSTKRRGRSSLFLLSPIWVLLLSKSSHGHGNGSPPRNAVDILVVGSMNLDTFIPLSRLPTEGENLTLLPGCDPAVEVPGGKGCCQAVACSKLSLATDKTHRRGHVAFLGQIGNNDDKASILTEALTSNGVDISHCERCSDHPAGHAYVFLQKDTGKVSAVIGGGSNLYGWSRWKTYYDAVGILADADGNANANRNGANDGQMVQEHNQLLDNLLFPQQATTAVDTTTDTYTGIKCLLLQREIPEFVNLILARHAKNRNRNDKIIVLQDIGGEDRPISSEMLSLCDYVVPNRTELERLVRHFEPDLSPDDNTLDTDAKHVPIDRQIQQTITFARVLQKHGATDVLVTLGMSGSVLLRKDGTVVYRKAHAVPAGCKVLDETGAGDCYRAAFAVALTEAMTVAKGEGELDIEACMEFASAAGALAVTKEGAVPGVPSRREVDALVMQSRRAKVEEETLRGRGRSSSGATPIGRGGDQMKVDDNSHGEKSEPPFPFLFGSRLNSMKDRPELHSSPSLLVGESGVREWVRRQSRIRGLGCVDFNYPQHFHSWTATEAKVALQEAELVAGAVCLRYSSKFARGAMNHPEEALRREAIKITKEAADVARELGCKEVVVWSAYDGYDYPFQVDYNLKWKQLVQTFRECCDEYPDIKWSLEYKPTDENTRFFTVPSTGAAILLINEIDRPNMGLTLDVGHMLMAGENPGQSIAMVGGDKLFGIQLNDGYTRLAAEDGMMFGSIHPTMALEVMYQLRKIDFKGHLYFDTFPQRTDPVEEAEYNIQRVKKFWKAAGRMDGEQIRKVMEEHNAIGALNLCISVLEMP